MMLFLVCCGLETLLGIYTNCINLVIPQVGSDGQQGQVRVMILTSLNKYNNSSYLLTIAYMPGPVLGALLMATLNASITSAP